MNNKYCQRIEVKLVTRGQSQQKSHTCVPYMYLTYLSVGLLLALIYHNIDKLK
jgi:hypothetical protein